MSKAGKRGHVEFRPPMIQLAADLPGDEDMREHLNDLKMNDGFQGSCGPLMPNANSKRKEADVDE
ncbi:hypothetical protein [Paenibacillus barengoltzii]|uniref:Uncharacterized protein n=1 Tax=Paenibacillus barengoltzii J12 TaxID=935846 RepID=A0ABY1LV15_9BACL|nr:hypothetical protein [Paenibacillus barengoltzii]SMF07230.1 hypothetical protein SAMN02744124_01110 [Paenibacillus barengoltzii J12]